MQVPFFTRRLADPSATHKRPSTATLLTRLVRDNPGLPVGEIGKRLQLSAGTLHYHIARLSASEEIVTRVAGRRRLVFPPAAEAPPEDTHALSLLRGRTAWTIASWIAQNPGRPLCEIVDGTKESTRAVYYTVKLLKEADLIRSSLETRYRDLRPTPRLLRLLDQVSPPPPAPAEWGVRPDEA